MNNIKELNYKINKLIIYKKELSNKKYINVIEEQQRIISLNYIDNELKKLYEKATKIQEEINESRKSS